jgi:hypothetical protein
VRLIALPLGEVRNAGRAISAVIRVAIPHRRGLLPTRSRVITGAGWSVAECAPSGAIIYRPYGAGGSAHWLLNHAGRPSDIIITLVYVERADKAQWQLA